MRRKWKTGQTLTFSITDNSRLCDNDILKDLNLLLSNPDVKSYSQSMLMDHAAHLGKMLAQLVSGAPVKSPTAQATEPTVYLVGGKDSPLYKSFHENLNRPLHIQPTFIVETAPY